MRKNRLLALLLAACMALGCLPLPAGAYSDTDTHWSRRAVERWTGYGVVEGDEGGDTFRPDDPITRGEVAKILAVTLGLERVAENTFSDLGDAWYRDYVLRVVAGGAMEGYPDGTVGPENNITRQEAAKLLAAALGILPVEGAPGFEDDGEIGDWAMGYVKSMRDTGVIEGYDGRRFGPLDSIDRGSLVTILDKAIAAYITEPGEYTGQYDGIVLVKTGDVVFDQALITGNLIVAEGVREPGAVVLADTQVQGEIIAGDGVVVVRAPDPEEPEPTPSPTPGGDPAPTASQTPAPPSPQLGAVGAGCGGYTLPVRRVAAGDRAYIYVDVPVALAKERGVVLTLTGATAAGAIVQRSGLLETAYSGSRVEVEFTGRAQAEDFLTGPPSNSGGEGSFDLRVEAADGGVYYIAFIASAGWTVSVAGPGWVAIGGQAAGGTAFVSTATGETTVTLTPDNGADLVELVIGGRKYTDLDAYYAGGAYAITLDAESRLYALEAVFGESELKRGVDQFVVGLEEVLGNFGGLDIQAGDGLSVEIDLDTFSAYALVSIYLSGGEVNLINGSLLYYIREYIAAFDGLPEGTVLSLDGHPLDTDRESALAALLWAMGEGNDALTATVTGPDTKAYSFSLDLRVDGTLPEHGVISIYPEGPAGTGILLDMTATVDLRESLELLFSLDAKFRERLADILHLLEEPEATFSRIMGGWLKGHQDTLGWAPDEIGDPESLRAAFDATDLCDLVALIGLELDRDETPIGAYATESDGVYRAALGTGERLYLTVRIDFEQVYQTFAQR